MLRPLVTVRCRGPARDAECPCTARRAAGRARTPHVAHHRPAPRRTRQGRARRAVAAGNVLLRRGERRRLALDRLRARLAAAVRQRSNRIRRRDRRRAVESRHHLRRIGRGHAAPRPLHRRRHLQVGGQRRHLDAPRAARRAADREDHRRSREPEPVVRCRARTPVRAQHRARHLPLRGRRPVVPARALQGREHRRRRSPLCSRRPQHGVCRAVGGAAGPVGERCIPGAGVGPLQERRRRHHVEAAHRGPPDVRQGWAGAHRTCRGTGQSEAALCHGGCGACRRRLSIRRRRRDVDAHHRRRTLLGARIRLCRAHGGPAQRRHRLFRQRRHVEEHRRRRDVDGAARRPGRRRLPAALDRSSAPERDAPRGRPGRDHHGERRRDVELVVQPAHGTVLSRRHRQRVSVSRLRRAAGVGVGVRREPRQRRRHHLPRIPPGRLRRVRIRRPRPARPRHRLRRPHPALRPAHGTGAAGCAQGPSHRALSHAAYGAAALLADQSSQALLRVQHGLADDERRRALEGDLPRPHAHRLRRAAERGRLRQLGTGARATPRCRVHDRAEPGGQQHDLGRNGRRADPGHAQQRQELDERHAASAAAMGQGLAHGRLAHRRQHRLRGRQHPAPRRPAPAHLAHARRGQVVDRNRARHSARHGDKRGARGPEAARAPLCGQRAGGLRLVQRRRRLAVVAAQHAALERARPRDQGRRPGGGHARSRLLDSRQHHAAATARPADRRIGPAVRARARHAGALEHEYRHAAAARRADRGQSARRHAD